MPSTTTRTTATPAATAAPVVLTADQINDAYRTNFGRDADAAGLAYWLNDKSLSADTLDAALRAGAAGSDVVAAADSAQYDMAWNPGLNANASDLTYNSVTNRWEQPKNVVPTSAVADVAAPTATAREITPSETVNNQLMGLINQNSPYMQSATNRAMEQANARGLLNSSLAVGTGQRAAIDASLPIAQQDAQTYATAGQSTQDANEAIQQTGYTANLNSAQAYENFGYQGELNDQNVQGNIDIANNQATINSALQQQQDDAAMARLQEQIGLDLSKLSQTDKEAFANATSPLFQQASADITAISNTPDSVMNAAAKDTAIKNAQTLLESNVESLSALYSYEIDWTPATLGLLSEAPEPADTFIPGSAPDVTTLADWGGGA